MRHGAGGRASTGGLLQVLGLVLLPVAVWYGITREDIWTELGLAGLGIVLILLGRNLGDARRT